MNRRTNNHAGANNAIPRPGMLATVRNRRGTVTSVSPVDKGIGAFLTQNRGEGWLLPETLCLVDFGLSHDGRAQHRRPVASRLGPRFYDWQLVRSAEEVRRECHLHARNLLGAAEYAQLLDRLTERRQPRGREHHRNEFVYPASDPIHSDVGEARRVAEAEDGYSAAAFRKPGQTEMFPRPQTELPL